VKSNRGYTLVELLITLALTGLVFIIAGSAIYQLNTAAVFGNDRLTALHEIQNAGFRFSQDVKEARSAAGDSSNLSLTMADDSLIVYHYFVSLPHSCMNFLSRSASLRLERRRSMNTGQASSMEF